MWYSIHRKMNGGYRYDELDYIGRCQNCHVCSGDRAAENFALCCRLPATGRTIHGCRQCLLAGCCRYRKRPETAYRYGCIKQHLLPYKSRAVFHSDEIVRLLTLYRPATHPIHFTAYFTRQNHRCAAWAVFFFYFMFVSFLPYGTLTVVCRAFL